MTSVDHKTHKRMNFVVRWKVYHAACRLKEKLGLESDTETYRRAISLAEMVVDQKLVDAHGRIVVIGK